MLQVHFFIIIILISLHQRNISALITSSINFDPIQEKMTKDTPELIDIGDDISLRIVRWGNPEVLNGRPILMVHGLASNALLWKGSALALVNLGHPVIGVDLRGHGPFSSKPDDEYDVVTVTNDISRLLLVLKEKEDFKKPIVLGQSWGGNLVVELAHKYPQLIGGIVGVDGGFLELSTRYPTWAECEKALKPPNVIGKSIHEIREYFIRSHPDWPSSSLEGMLEILPLLFHNPSINDDCKNTSHAATSIHLGNIDDDNDDNDLVCIDTNNDDIKNDSNVGSNFDNIGTLFDSNDVHASVFTNAIDLIDGNSVIDDGINCDNLDVITCILYIVL